VHYALFIFSILYIFFEVPNLWRDKKWKEFLISFLLLAIGISYGLDYIYNVDFLPEPNSLLKLMIPLAEWVFSLLGIKK